VTADHVAQRWTIHGTHTEGSGIDPRRAGLGVDTVVLYFDSPAPVGTARMMRPGVTVAGRSKLVVLSGRRVDELRRR